MILNILGESIKVNYLDQVLVEGEETDGSFDSSTMTICVSNKAYDKHRILLHEVSHAIFYLIGVTSESVPDLIEEILCESISLGMNQVMNQLANLKNE